MADNFVNVKCLFASILILIFCSSYSIDSSDRAFYKDLVKVIEASDVLLEVLDARDPLGTRCVDIEKMVMKSGPDKRLVLLLNKIGSSLITFHFVSFLLFGIFIFALTNCLALKIDLVPKEALEKWLKYLREELPTVAFKCSTQQQRSNLSDCLGADTLIKLLKNYSRSHEVAELFWNTNTPCNSCSFSSSLM